MGAKVVLFGNTQQESKLMHIYFGIRFYGIYLTWMTNQAPLCANYYRTLIICYLLMYKTNAKAPEEF